MNEPSTPTAPDSPSQSGGERQPSLSQALLQANQELRAAIVSNVIKKSLIGLGVGVGLGLFVFKSIGLGMAYSEGSQMVRDYHEGLRRRAIGDTGHHRLNCPYLHHHHEETPPGELN